MKETGKNDLTLPKPMSTSLQIFGKVSYSQMKASSMFLVQMGKTVWRKPNTSLETKHLRAIIKHGGGHVMVWGCMTYNGVGNLAFVEGNMDARQYIEILRGNLLASASKLELRMHFTFNMTMIPSIQPT